VAVNRFIVQAPGANVTKLFMAVSYEFFNKLECLSLANLSRIVHCLQARQEPIQVCTVCSSVVKWYNIKRNELNDPGFGSQPWQT
jgi:hypothetical protein